MPHVRPTFFGSAWDSHSVRVLGSFLWADATRGALQVFLQQQFQAVENPGAVMGQEETEEGNWITVDPIPGCIVCNIGESQWVIIYPELQASDRYVIVWEVWTNGLYKSTLHRVIHRGSNYR
jgi:isopenicillin N synthase-like dioxygenase